MIIVGCSQTSLDLSKVFWNSKFLIYLEMNESFYWFLHVVRHSCKLLGVVRHTKVCTKCSEILCNISGRVWVTNVFIADFLLDVVGYSVACPKYLEKHIFSIPVRFRLLHWFLSCSWALMEATVWYVILLNVFRYTWSCQ